MTGGVSIKKNIIRILYYFTAIIAVAIIFVSSYSVRLADFQNTAEFKQTALNNAIKPCYSFIEIMTVYGNHFFENDMQATDEKIFSMIKYDPVTDTYNLDSVKGTPFASRSGSISGIGTIPSSEAERLEINMSLSFFIYYSKFYDEMPDITWLYYTSHNNFLAIYPWVSSSDYKYSEKSSELPFYTVAIPENNPSRVLVWTPVYQDEIGKNLMVTLSSPIYDNNEFKGVISLDLTTNTFRKLLKGKYESYLIDNTEAVITTGQNIVFEDGVKKIYEMLGKNTSYQEKIRQLQTGKVERIGSNYIYKYSFEVAPWSMVMVVSIYSVIFHSLLQTLPIFVICILLLFTVGEVEHRKKAENRIKAIALSDELTGLKNRHFLDTYIVKEIAQSDRYDRELSIVIFDLDHFKKVNDSWGHPVGDDVLRRTARVAENLIRSSDTIFRIGGEEFLIVLPETDIVGAYDTAEKIRKALEITVHPVAGKCTASFGIAQRNAGESFIELYKRADEAMYHAKEGGRNCVAGQDESFVAPLAQVRLEWNSKWNSGDKHIDAQHRELLELSNRLLSLSLSNDDYNKIQIYLDLVIKYIEDHFAYEENFQKEIGYPDVKEHAEIHKHLVEKAMRIKTSYLSGKIRPSEFFSFMLDDIVVGHLQEQDTKFFPYIQKNKKSTNNNHTDMKFLK